MRDLFDEKLAAYERKEQKKSFPKGFASDEHTTPPFQSHQRREKGARDRMIMNRVDKLAQSAHLVNRGMDVMSESTHRSEADGERVGMLRHNIETASVQSK